MLHVYRLYARAENEWISNSRDFLKEKRKILRSVKFNLCLCYSVFAVRDLLVRFTFFFADC